MLTTILCWLFVAVASSLCDSTLFNVDDSETTKSDLLDAVDEVLSNSFKSSAVTINFIVSLSDETKVESNILINNLVSRCDVVFIEDVQFITQRQRLHNVIFIDDFKSFLRLSQRMSSNNFVIDGYFLIVLVNGPIEEMSDITRWLWSVFIYKVDFVVEQDTVTSLITFLPFSQPPDCLNNENCKTRCDDSTPIVVQTFQGSSQTKKNYFPEKISNMFQCPVKVVTFNCPPMMMIRYDEARNYELQGADGEMLKVLAEILNFKIDLIHISDSIRFVASSDFLELNNNLKLVFSFSQMGLIE